MVRTVLVLEVLVVEVLELDVPELEVLDVLVLLELDSDFYEIDVFLMIQDEQYVNRHRKTRRTRLRYLEPLKTLFLMTF